MITTEKEFVKLTPTVHDLIRVALEELVKRESMEGHVVDMDHWIRTIYYKAESYKVCTFCWAGSIMLGIGELKKWDFGDLTPCAFSWPVESRLLAIDDIRVGLFIEALDTLQVDDDTLALVGFSTKEKTPKYRDNPELFITFFLCMAEYFEPFNLEINTYDQ